MGRLRRAHGIWKRIDATLAGVSRGLQKTLRTLVAIRVLVMVLALGFLALAVTLWFYPQWTPYVVMGILVGYALPLFGVFYVVGLPFRMKSAVRLIRKGYPENVEELTIRMVARKMRDQSIETERLFYETAWNECRKVYDRTLRRAQRLRRHLDDLDERPDDPVGKR